MAASCFPYFRVRLITCIFTREPFVAAFHMSLGGPRVRRLKVNLGGCTFRRLERLLSRGITCMSKSKKSSNFFGTCSNGRERLPATSEDARIKLSPNAAGDARRAQRREGFRAI